MFQKNNLEIAGYHIPLYLDKAVVQKIQDLVDQISVMASLLEYKIIVDSNPRASYDSITFEKEDNKLAIYFQHISKTTICYCLCNDEHIAINKLKGLL